MWVYYANCLEANLCCLPEESWGLFIWKQIMHPSRPALWPKCWAASSTSLSLGVLVQKVRVKTVTARKCWRDYMPLVTVKCCAGRTGPYKWKNHLLKLLRPQRGFPVIMSPCGNKLGATGKCHTQWCSTPAEVTVACFSHRDIRWVGPMSSLARSSGSGRWEWAVRTGRCSLSVFFILCLWADGGGLSVHIAWVISGKCVQSLSSFIQSLFFFPEVRGHG